MKPDEAAAQEADMIRAALRPDEVVEETVIGTFIGPTRVSAVQHRTLAFTSKRILVAGVAMRWVQPIPLRALVSVDLRSGLLAKTVTITYELRGLTRQVERYDFAKRDPDLQRFVDAVQRGLDRSSSRRGPSASPA